MHKGELRMHCLPLFHGVYFSSLVYASCEFILWPVLDIQTAIHLLDRYEHNKAILWLFAYNE